MNRNLKFSLIFTSILVVFSYLMYLHYLDTPIKKLALDENCLPKGNRATHQAKSNPQIFWQAQTTYVKDSWQSYKQIIAFAKVEQERDKMNEDFDKKANKALGLNEDIELDEQIKSAIDEARRNIKAEEQADYIREANWTKKCLVMAKLQIGR